ncbi:MAG: PQQ-dependent sugar dehydrogenase [Acidobacteria bacterium]|nr:MAG: PQQ-dependent sugar dehydrogenase [Acidobacteriota bacterium]
MRLARLAVLCVIVVVLAAFVAAVRRQGPPGARVPPEAVDRAGQAVRRDCKPLETERANAPDQQPAFPGQTRACGVTSKVAFDVVVLARGLAHPWAVEPLPGGDLLVTERPGRMRIVSAAGALGQPIGGVPAVVARGQGGLLDVALSPSFATDHTIYWSYSEPRQGGNATSVARGVLSPDRQRLGEIRVIFRAMPTFNGAAHFGSRLTFGRDGMLYVTLGERSDRAIRPQAQHRDSHMGKIVRIRPDGSTPPDNPFVGEDGTLPEIWTLGHRNVQSAALDENGRLWTVEHGARGGDELNLIERGKNYGWPLVTYGEEYSGEPIAGSVTDRPGFERPVYYWDPVIAPSGAQFYTGDAFPAWKGSLFVGGLEAERLVRLRIEGDRVTGEEHLLADRGQRIRDVRQGPDGSLFIVTDENDGELWKIVPRR